MDAAIRHPGDSRAFPNVFKVLGSIKTMIDRGVLWKDISSSLISVISGYALGFVIALPVAILMAWYKPVRFVIERGSSSSATSRRWLRAADRHRGGRRPQAADHRHHHRLLPDYVRDHLSGVINVDETLIKAARVLGATDKDIFIRVIAPATFRSS